MQLVPKHAQSENAQNLDGDQSYIFFEGSAFSIDNETGKIVTTRPLDRENISQYLLTVQVIFSLFCFFYRSVVRCTKGE